MQDLETLKEENKRLKSTRSEMDDELHTLTENLFEEAYKMVDEAKGNKVREMVLDAFRRVSRDFMPQLNLACVRGIILGHFWDKGARCIHNYCLCKDMYRC